MRNVTEGFSDKSILANRMVSWSLQRSQEMADNHPWYMSVRRFLGIRPKVGVDQFFQWYYDSKVFHEVANPRSSYWDLVLKFITRSDPTLADVDHARFKKEMRSMWLAFVSLAVKDSLLERDTSRTDIPRYILAEISFTRNYLERNGHVDIWKNMLIYNDAMSKNMPAMRARHKFIREFLLKEINEDYMAHIENLYLTRRLDSTVRNLLGVLAEKLGWDVTDLNSDVFLNFEVVVLTHYGDVKGLLDIVSLRL